MLTLILSFQAAFPSRLSVMYRWTCRWRVGSEQGPEQAVVELGVEDRDALPFRGEGVDVRAVAAFDDAVEAEPAEVVAHLVAGVRLAEQVAHLGTQAPVAEPDDVVQGDTQGAGQGHDPRVAES